jgi:hypothetical protein
VVAGSNPVTPIFLPFQSTIKINNLQSLLF